MCKLLCIISVCVWLPVVFCGSRDPNVTTISFNSKFSFSDDGSVVSECMADRSQYFVSENESVFITLHHNAEDVNAIVCNTLGVNITYINETKRSPYDLKYYVPSVNQATVFAYCLITLKLNVTGYVYSWCHVHIYSDMKNSSDDMYFSPTAKSIYVYLTVDPKNPYTMKDIFYYENSSLLIKCIEPDDEHYTHELIAEDNEGEVTKLKDGNFHISQYPMMDESLNDMKLLCAVTDKRTHTILRAGITLRYQNYIGDELDTAWILAFTFVLLPLTMGAVILIVQLYYEIKAAGIPQTPTVLEDYTSVRYAYLLQTDSEDQVPEVQTGPDPTGHD